MAKTEEYKILITADTRKAVSGVKGLGTSLKGLGFAAAGAAAVAFGKQMIDASKTFQTFTNQLRLVTKDQADLERLFGRLTAAAVENRTSLASTIELYQKLAVSTADLGKTEDQLLTVTGKLSQALAVAGADAGTTNGVIRQFGQAMASGTVRGDEFNSIVEGLGPALAIMAKESGLNVGELRKLAQSGKLTAEVMFNMLESSTALSSAFNSMSITTEQLEQQLSDSFTASLSALSDASGLTDAYNSVLKKLIRTFDDLADRQGSMVEMTVDQLMAHKNVNAALEEMEERLKEAHTAYRFTFSKESRDKAYAQYLAINDNVKALRESVAAAKEKAEQAKEDMRIEEERVASINEIIGAEMKLAKLYRGHDMTQYMNEFDKAKAKHDEYDKSIKDMVAAYAELQASNITASDEFAQLEIAIQNATVAKEHYAAIIDKLREKQELESKLHVNNKHAVLLSLKAQTALTQQAKDSIAIRSDYLNTIAAITTAEHEGAITGVEAIQLKQEADEKWTAEANRLSEQREQRAKQEEYAKLQAFIDAEKIKRDQLLLTRTAEYKKAGMSTEVAKKAAENMTAYEEDKTKFIIDNLSEQFKALGAHNKQAFEAYKAFAIAQAIMDTYKMATSAYAAMVGIPFIGPVLAVGAAAAAIATGMSNVNAIRSQQYSGRRFGGPVTGGSSYIVGEDSPEIFTPSQNGVITPMDQAGSGRDVNITFNINAVDSTSIDELLLERRALIQNVIREAVEENGQRSTF